jgi:2-polyprenyl-3-methyl-5-hydroxy-6-metoxy-1,4-benzoquinol methylase
MKKPLPEALRRASDAFLPKRQLYYYAKAKMIHDPAYAFCAKMLKNRSKPILDVGCGAGVLVAFLRENKIYSSIHGLDPDSGKISLAQQKIATRYSDCQFTVGRAENLPDFSGDVVALDILHYFEPDMQRLVLQGLLSKVSPQDGVLILRTTLKSPHWRYFATNLEEGFIRASSWISGGAWNFPTREELLHEVARAGFRSLLLPMWGNTPFHSFLLIARP